MLGKLLKYEFKNGAKLMPVVFLGTGIVFLLAWFFKAIHVGQLMLPMMIVLVIGAIACVLVPFVFIIMRYHKGVFGAEGYLTNTLPVSEGTILASRMITGFVWYLLGMLFCILAIFAMCFLAGVPNFAAVLQQIFQRYWMPILVFGIVLLIQMAMSISAIYFSITLANIPAFSRNNIAFSVLFYFLSYTVMSFVELGGMLLIPLGIRIDAVNGEMSLVAESMFSYFMDSVQGNANTHMVIGVGSAIVDLVFAAAFIFVTWKLLKRKVMIK